MPQLEDTTIKTFHQWLPPDKFGTWQAVKHNYLVQAFENCEIEIMFRALDRPDHVRNLLSLEVTGAFVNEAREVPWAIIEALQGRVGQYPAKNVGGPTWSGVWMDTNPPDTDSAFYRFFEETALPPGFAVLFKQPSGLSVNAENLKNLPNGRRYYENLAVGKAREWVKVYIDGQYGFVIDGQPVYTEYKDERHCCEVGTIADLPVYVGLDWGLTPAAVFAQVTPRGRLVVVDELCAEGFGAERFTRMLALHLTNHFRKRDFVFVGDPAGQARSQTDEQTCFQIAEKILSDTFHSQVVIEAGPVPLQARIEPIRQSLSTYLGGEPEQWGFAIHPRCRVLRKGFMGGYQYQRVLGRGDRLHETPLKNMYSHPHDALEMIAGYVLSGAMMEPRRPAEDGFERYHEDAYAEMNRNEVTGY